MTERKTIGTVLEGLSYSGKSTTIEATKGMEELKDCGVIAVPEYSVMGPLPAFEREDLDDLKKMVNALTDLEKRRTDLLTDGLAKNPRALVLWDRGPISLLAFEYAAMAAGFKHATLLLAEGYQRLILGGEIVVPRGVVLLRATPETISARRESDLRKGKGDVIPFLRNPRVIGALERAFDLAGKIAQEGLFATLWTDRKEPYKVAVEVLHVIENQPPDIEQDPLGIIAYANLLLKS